ncbi:MAG: hypothetical protein QGH54_15735 [SAR202 cluster bacterium]|nr:hypothetical protein [SAR202 cluster bacterium]
MPTPVENLHSVAQWMDIPRLSANELLQTFAAILEELPTRDISRSSNNPAADYTEWLVCSKLRLRRQPNSNAGFDAISEDGTKFEIKARRMTPHNSSVQLSAIRNLEAKHFDYLVGVVYEVDFSIPYAAKVPHAVIEPNSTYSEHANSHIFHLSPKILGLSAVDDITGVLAN